MNLCQVCGERIHSGKKHLECKYDIYEPSKITQDEYYGRNNDNFIYWDGEKYLTFNQWLQLG